MAPDGSDASDTATEDGRHSDPDRAGQLHHLELYASNLEASIDFWGWLLGELGYERQNDWAGGRSWINGPTYVVLVAADDAVAADHPFDRRAAGLNHVAFHAASNEHVDAITAGVRERADAEVLYDDRHPYAGGYYALYCEDPEGIKVEVVGPE
ncbi:glyoxalase/bleomycin resistance protein/dioxygenase [Halovivax asiaticus JCM 14624]|uniref:Glyoxalase/bleomycin resistance protein/dioxygenase n=1 Tax=Halovivax asiaticus JCM 14624 TaxID=1227490 RepID=M0BG95_9EURY|nr:VOC family protein [Halovivax asiaticus]ELZ09916.1 glyoxalase/bleomycin resistance protein/dioxygenase [Halovivax asiaticus JCM 14624]